MPGIRSRPTFGGCVPPCIACNGRAWLRFRAKTAGRARRLSASNRQNLNTMSKRQFYDIPRAKAAILDALQTLNELNGHSARICNAAYGPGTDAADRIDEIVERDFYPHFERIKDWLLELLDDLCNAVTDARFPDTPGAGGHPHETGTTGTAEAEAGRLADENSRLLGIVESLSRLVYLSQVNPQGAGIKSPAEA